MPIDKMVWIMVWRQCMCDEATYTSPTYTSPLVPLFLSAKL